MDSGPPDNQALQVLIKSKYYRFNERAMSDNYANVLNSGILSYSIESN